MANELIKKIAIKTGTSGSGSWESREIGAKAANISLSSPVAGINSNVEQVLQTVLPENTLASGFIESNNGQLTKSSKSDAITNFFETGNTAPYQGNLSQLKEDLEDKVSLTGIDQIISNYLQEHAGEHGEITPGLTPVQILNLVYPIGSVLTLFSENTPQQLGLGNTWEQITDQKFLLPSTSTAGLTGGRASTKAIITLDLPNLIQIGPHENYTPSGRITSNLEVAKNNLGLNTGGSYANQVVAVNSNSDPLNIAFEGTQVSLNHNIQTQATRIQTSEIQLYPPYVTVHMWKRTSLDPNTTNFHVIGEDGDQTIIDYIIDQITGDTGFDFDIITDPTASKWEDILLGTN